MGRCSPPPSTPRGRLGGPAPGLKPRPPSPPQVKSLIFDQSGTYLALGGTDVQIYICKQWTEILHFTGEGAGGRRGGPLPRRGAALLALQSPAHPGVGVVTTGIFSSPPPEHSGLTTGVAFGHHAKFIASTGMDRSLKFYSL